MKRMYFKMAMLMTSLAFANETSTTEVAPEPPKETDKTPFIKYNNRIFMMGYDRTKPDSFYFGTRLWAMPVLAGRTAFHFITEAELRVGYNLFYNGRDHVTPIVGAGGFYDTKKLHSRHQPVIIYGTFGCLYDHEFNATFNLGLNLKGLVGGAAHIINKKVVKWDAPVLGCDIGVPFTFRFGEDKSWDFRLEPFDIYLRGENRGINYFGVRTAFGYRF